MISVLMPVYNGLPLVKASVQSLQKQTYEDWECIIVDDGSTDGTSEYLDSLEDNRFVVHHFEMNKGRPKARQKTLELAKGDYISMLDAEDLYANNALEVLHKKIQEHPEVVLVSASMCSFGTKTNITRKRGILQERIVKYDGKHLPNHASSIMRSERAKRFKYNPLMKLGQDRDFLERYLKGESFMEIPDVLYYYSEFDSVNKRKIKKTYKLNMIKYANSGNIGQLVINFVKLTIATIIFPFVSDVFIIKNRGVELSKSEEESFVKDCKRIVESII